MASHYDHRALEKKWQDRFEQSGIFHAEDGGKKEKFYVLVEFPYPSGAGLHVGHPRSYTALDVVARQKRMEGKNVLFPMGWDAFGLPAENYALKTGIHPRIVTQENIATFRRQLKSIGFSFDWSREVDTTDPKYYRWTQWMFLEFFKAGLAYKAKIFINWCPKDTIGLSHEEFVGGASERCGTPVEKRDKEQWLIAITKYADRLLKDLDTVDYLPKIKKQQEEWIGRSEGAEIDFSIASTGQIQEVVFASTNQGKLKRMRHLLQVAGLSIALKTPEDLGIKHFEVIEDGKTLEENAEKKARALAELTGLPVLADDSGFFISGEKIDPVTVKRNALAGVDEKSFSVEQIGEKMLAYYQQLAAKRGGKVDAEWRNALCVITPDKHLLRATAVRSVLLTDTPHGVMDPHLPLRPLYISKATGKYVLLQDEAEEMRELQPITDALKDILAPKITVFTTRPDTLFGVTYVVLAPEHSLVAAFTTKEQKKAVEKYLATTKKKTDIERGDDTREKTGVFTGAYAVNPVNGEKVPVWVADYVLAGYGTGAVMAVPQHDERDRDFAEKFELPILNRPLVSFDEAVKKAGGRKTVKYKLRDWVFSRQRYWGEPIPLVHCESGCSPETGGWVAVPEKDLPVLLPEVEKYQPTETGESPLANISSFVNTTCPQCGGKGKRETDTMPNWAGSSWYFLRYADPHNDEAFASKEKLKQWMPVDLYNGGMEHTVLHLLYSRFWNKFLFDRGLVPTSEPYKRRHSHGLIMAEDGSKMSKSKGNVVNPDEIVQEFGADTLRLYELFMGPFEEPVPWSTNGVIGVRRFLEKVKRYVENWKAGPSDAATAKLIEKTVKKVGDDIENFSFNTAVSAFMILFNELPKHAAPTKVQLERVLCVLVPFAPHLANELWETIGNSGLVEQQTWPVADAKLLVDATVKLVVQVGGKTRDTVTVATGASETEALAAAKTSAKVAAQLEGKTVKKIIFVPNRLLNIVVE